MGYDATTLWHKAFDHCNDGEDDNRDHLRNAYEQARGNATSVLDKIRKDFPSLTVHDITHVDSLWHVASTIAGDDYDITPLEGFVLGCAFLLHDSALSYEAAGGVAVLRDTTEWKDYYVDYSQVDSLGDEEKLFETDFRTIRALHAKKAETIYNQIFQREDGASFYIIEDAFLRTHLGKLIGQIAASHHWNIDDLENLDEQSPSPRGYDPNWQIIASFLIFSRFLLFYHSKCRMNHYYSLSPLIPSRKRDVKLYMTKKGPQTNLMRMSFCSMY